MLTLSPSPFRAALFAALLLPLTAAGCATAQTSASDAEDATIQTPALNEPFRLGVGETARVDGHAIRFAEVVEDSRCPEGVACVWEGRAQVRIEVDGASAVLTTPRPVMRDDETTSVRVGGRTLEVTGVTPYPGSADAEAGAPVQATFVVTPE